VDYVKYGNADKLKETSLLILRGSFYGTEGRGFESLQPHQLRFPPLGGQLLWQCNLVLD
jgi:hypothetical protein